MNKRMILGFYALSLIGACLAWQEFPLWIGIPFAIGVIVFLVWTFIQSRGNGSLPARGAIFRGDSIEVDCRLCGQFNRVPATRLRMQRPICGRCKKYLMPKNRIVLCHTSTIEGPLRAELNALWSDEDRLWDCLTAHLAMMRRAVDDRQKRSVN